MSLSNLFALPGTPAAAGLTPNAAGAPSSQRPGTTEFQPLLASLQGGQAELQMLTAASPAALMGANGQLLPPGNGLPVAGTTLPPGPPLMASEEMIGSGDEAEATAMPTAPWPAWPGFPTPTVDPARSALPGGSLAEEGMAAPAPTEVAMTMTAAPAGTPPKGAVAGSLASGVATSAELPLDAGHGNGGDAALIPAMPVAGDVVARATDAESLEPTGDQPLMLRRFTRPGGVTDGRAGRGEGQGVAMALRPDAAPATAGGASNVQTAGGEADQFAALVEDLTSAAGEAPGESGPAVQGGRETSTRAYQSAAPATAQVQVPVGKPGWSEAVFDKVMWFSAQQLSSAEIQLSPPELGPMQVRVSTQNEQATVYFSSHHAQVREALDQALPRLRELFESQGMQLADAGVGERSFAEQRASQQGQGGGKEGQGGSGASTDEAPAAETAMPVRAASGLLDAYA